MNSPPPQPILQAGILESKVEVGKILAPVSMSKPVNLGSSLVGITGNQVAPPDSYAMFRHLMEAKVTRKSVHQPNQNEQNDFNLGIMFRQH